MLEMCVVKEDTSITVIRQQIVYSQSIIKIPEREAPLPTALPQTLPTQ